MVAFGQTVYCKRTFLHAQSFSISADAPLMNESIVTSKTISCCVCPFSEDSRRREEETERQRKKGSRKKIDWLFFVSWKAANTRERACNYNEMHRWNRFNGCNSLPVTSTATTFCRFAFSPYCISVEIILIANSSAENKKARDKRTLKENWFCFTRRDNFSVTFSNRAFMRKMN